MSLKNKYFFLYLILITISFYIFNYNKEVKVQEYLDNKTNFMYQKYNVLFKKYEDIANMIYTVDINKKEVIDTFKDAHLSDNVKKEEIRQKLLKELQLTYKTLKKYQIKQLHFHLPNNESFLRFHRPNKYGDNLSNIRESVAYVNKHKKPISSFEEGRIFNGFRFIFPLFSNSSHIGSVEVSFSTMAFNYEFIKSYQEATYFLIKKDIVDKKVFNSEKQNYVSSAFDNYYIEKENLKQLNNFFNKKATENITYPDKLIEKLNSNLDNLYGIYDESSNKVITFIPVINHTTKNKVGLFVIKSDSKYIFNTIKNFYTTIFLFNLLTLVIFIFIYNNHKSQIKLNTVIQEADSGIAIMDLDGNFKEVNTKYCQLLSYKKRELLKLSCFDLVPKEDIEKSKRLIEKAIEKRSISKKRKKCLRKDNSIVNVEFSIKLLPSHDSFIIVMNSLEDKIKLEKLNDNLQKEVNKAIQDIKQKEQMLFHQSKLAALGEMIDAIAHQWKNPLSIMKLYIEHTKLALSDKEINKDEILEYSTKQELQISHLVNTIDEFRGFFRPNTKMEEIEIIDIIESTKKLMKDELVSNQISIEISGDENSMFNIIPNEFKHVLLNLFSNSRDAFVEKGIKDRTIFIDIETNKKQKLLKVYDNAGGVSNEILSKLFEPNFTTKQSDKGTGIGLYITKQIVEKNLGTISCKNIDKGLCFTISFNKEAPKQIVESFS